MLNKQKIIQNHKQGKLKFEELTPFQRKIIGIKEPESILSKIKSEKSLSSMNDAPKAVGNKFQPKTVIRGGNKNTDKDKPIVIRKK